MNFEDAWDLTMSWEGGGRLHEVPGDPGGLTKYGISQRAHPDVDIANMGRGTAQALARLDYWDKVQADALPTVLRWQVFDMAFNSGPNRAVRLLQLSINLCQRSRGIPYDIELVKVDGQIGPQTLGAIRGLAGNRLLRVFKAYRVEHYIMLAEIDMAKFIHGWLRRAEGERNG